MTNQEPGGARGTASGAPDPETVRAEAERLVATGLAAVSMVADRIGAPKRERGGSVAASYDAIGDMLFGSAGHRHSVANDSPECCRCPVCRVISVAREPNPQVAERLATGVGTVAEGAARLLRGLAGATGSVRDSRSGPRDQGHGAATRPEPSRTDPPVARAWVDDDPWAAATAEPAPVVPRPAAASPTTAAVEPAATPPDSEPVARQAVAKKAVAKKAVAKKAAVEPPPARKAVAKKAVARKAVAKKAVAKKAVAKKAVAKKAVAKKAVAKKAVAKKAVAKQTGTGAAAGGATGEVGQ